MPYHEEEKRDPSTSSGRGKKGGFFNHFLKLITLGGLLLVVFKAFQKSKENKEK